ncbi:MAG: hypothetical protein H5T61_10380 [Thermoflexales bacterium]|nr:hypothetical protein [Thermoflexales bacterium]
MSSVVLTLQEEAVPLVRSGLAMKRAALSLNLKRYSQRLKDFEQRYHMDSQTFAARFGRGELGDEADWFEWEYVLQAYQETIRQLKILERLSV